MYYQQLYQFGYSHGQVPDIDNEQLAKHILVHGKRASENIVSTKHEDFHFPENEQFSKVITYIQKEFNYLNPRRMLETPKYYWSQVHEYRESSTLHDHYDSSDNYNLSGVYYVQVLEGAGDLVFNIPEGKYKTNRFQITPLVGQYFLFPSWLEHFVTKNYSADQRISISFNLKESAIEEFSNDGNAVTGDMG